MHSVYWDVAVLLFVGSTSYTYAGPLHAQCKVEWYGGIFLFFFFLLMFHMAFQFYCAFIAVLDNEKKSDENYTFFFFFTLPYPINWKISQNKL